MNTKARQASMEVYAELMREAKSRLDGLAHLIHGQHGFGPAFVEEFAYLQLRMLAEIIAVACFVAHGELPETAKLRDLWESDKIIKALDNLHADFYPHPCRREKLEAGGFHLHEGPDDYLKKEDFGAFVGRLGGKLHRGKLKNILKRNSTVQHDFPAIEQMAKRIGNLLSEHRVMFKGGDGFYYCALSDPSVNGEVNIILAEVQD